MEKLKSDCACSVSLNICSLKWDYNLGSEGALTVTNA